MNNDTPTAAVGRKKSPLITIIGVLSVIGVIAFGAYNFVEKGKLNQEIATIESETAALNSQLSEVNTAELQRAQTAQNILDVIESTEITWSDVISRIQDLTPVDEDGDQKILFSSYSGGGEGNVTLSATSRPDRGSETATLAFNDIAELIKIFNESNIFINGFVPSIAKGLTDEGDVILSFSFSAEYSPTRQKRTSEDENNQQ